MYLLCRRSCVTTESHGGKGGISLAGSKLIEAGYTIWQVEEGKGSAVQTSEILTQKKAKHLISPHSFSFFFFFFLVMKNLNYSLFILYIGFYFSSSVHWSYLVLFQVYVITSLCGHMICSAICLNKTFRAFPGVYFLAMWLAGSQFPNQKSNPGLGAEGAKS